MLAKHHPSPLLSDSPKRRKEKNLVISHPLKERVIGWRFYISFQENSNRLWELLTSHWPLADCFCLNSVLKYLSKEWHFPPVSAGSLESLPTGTRTILRRKWRRIAVWWEMLHLLLVFSWCGSGCLLSSNFLWLSSLVGSAPIQFSQGIEQHHRDDCSPPNRIPRFWTESSKSVQNFTKTSIPSSNGNRR